MGGGLESRCVGRVYGAVGVMQVGESFVILRTKGGIHTNINCQIIKGSRNSFFDAANTKTKILEKKFLYFPTVICTVHFIKLFVQIFPTLFTIHFCRIMKCAVHTVGSH